MPRTNFCSLLVVLLLVGCQNPQQQTEAPPIAEKDSVVIPEVIPDTVAAPVPKVITELEQQIIAAGLIELSGLDTTFVVDLRYTTTNNFLEADVYGDYDALYLQPDVAEKLVAAHTLLKSKHPHYRILIFDAVRPRSVQQKMWDLLADVPVNERIRYVSNPKNGSLHNFGAAVDVSIVDSAGNPLDMGTEFDHFGELAFPRKELEMLQQGQLTQQQIDNRMLLREVMHPSGFWVLPTEWWHFNSCSREEAYKRYTLVE